MLRRRLLSILLLVAFLLGLAQDLVRRTDAVHGHVVCPEHGELLHVGVAPVAETPDWKLPEQHGVACSLALPGGLLGALVLAPGAQAVAAPVAVGLDPPVAHVAVLPPVSPLRVAPKTSPPVA